MPSSDSAPNFALMTAVDLRDLSGETLYQRSTTNINITMASTIYADMIDFLNGYSASQTITDTIEHYATAASSPTAGDWDVRIDEDDLIAIRAGDPFDVDLDSGTDYLGIGSTTVSAVLVGSKYVATMPNNWIRGRVAGPWSFELTPNVGSAFTVTVDGEYQDLRVALRTTTATDVDGANAANNLSARDTSIMGLSGINSIRWLIDEEGYAVVSYPTAVSDLTWSSTALRNLLGFTGDETSTTVIFSSYERLKATYPCATVLIPTRPVERHQLSVETMATRRRRLGGSMVSNKLGTYTRSRVDFFLDAAADERDLYQHFVERFAPYTGPGQALTYYGEWGDSRRHAAPMSVFGSTYVVANYGPLYSIQDERGRYIGRLMENSFDLNYPTRIRRRVPLSVTIEHDQVR